MGAASREDAGEDAGAAAGPAAPAAAAPAAGAAAGPCGPARAGTLLSQMPVGGLAAQAAGRAAQADMDD